MPYIIVLLIGLCLGCIGRFAWTFFTERPVVTIFEEVIRRDEKKALQRQPPLLFDDLQSLPTPAEVAPALAQVAPLLPSETKPEEAVIPHVPAFEDYVREQLERPAQPSELQKTPNYDHIPHIDRLPNDLRLRIPAFKYNSHIYASEPSKRFVMLSQHLYKEGDDLVEGLKIAEIKKDALILIMADQAFLIPSMQDWDGA